MKHTNKYLLLLITLLHWAVLSAQVPVVGSNDSAYIGKELSDVPPNYTGTWKCFRLEGELYLSGNYKNGKMEGKWIKYKSDIISDLVERSWVFMKLGPETYQEFENNIGKEMEWLEYYGSGQVSLKVGYKNGKRRGELSIYKENVKQIVNCNYQPKEIQVKSIIDSLSEYDRLESYARFCSDILDLYDSLLMLNSEYYPIDVRSKLNWLVYYENGQLARKVKFTKEGPEGIIVEYYKTGKLAPKINYSNAERIGYYENGQLECKGRQYGSGPWVEYYENGQLKVKGEYKMGIENGKWVSHYENGQLYWKGNYEKMAREGEWLYYDTRGTLITKENYDYKTKTAERLWYYSSGQLESKLKLIHEEPLRRSLYSMEGELSEYYENGQLKRKGNYNNVDKENERNPINMDLKYEGITWGLHIKNFKWEEGYKEGEWQEYYANGQLASTGIYKKGKKIGDWLYYKEDGKPVVDSSKFFYVAKVSSDIPDNYTGIWKYYENGKLKRHGDLKDGKHDGEWLSYTEDGKLKDKENYVNGKLKFKINYINEKVVKECYYENGQLKSKGNAYEEKYDLYNGQYLVYYENGKLEYKIEFEGGRGQNSPYESYYESGQLKEKGYMVRGQWKEYYENGKLKEEGNHNHGGKDGEWLYYKEDGTLKETKFHRALLD